MSKSSGSKGRGRNRNSSGKRPQGRSGNFDPSGGRNRGNAQQLMDKYLTLARDATSQGDRIAAENYFQHADHYYRVVYARNEQQETRRRASNNGGGEAAHDPIPVQPVDDGQGKIGLVGDAGMSPVNLETTNANSGGNGEQSDQSASNETGDGDPGNLPAKKPRRGRLPKKQNDESGESPAPEAAE